MSRKPLEKKSRNKNNEEAVSEIIQHRTTTDLQNIIHMRGDLKCKNPTQKDLIKLINEKEIVIAAGPAGVGKSYITIARALELLKNPNNQYNKIIISKPAVEAEEKHGFLPGDMREKMDPFIASSLDIFDKLIGKSNRTQLEEHGYLEVQPLAYIRGKSIDNTIMIMEEAQNMSPSQMKTLLTRIGDNSKFIISGDLDQSDRYKNVCQSGLYDALNRHKNIEEIGFIEFTDKDIVRNKVISKILGNYKRDEKQPTKYKPQLLTENTTPMKISLKDKFLAFFKKT